MQQKAITQEWQQARSIFSWTGAQSSSSQSCPSSPNSWQSPTGCKWISNWPRESSGFRALWDKSHASSVRNWEAISTWNSWSILRRFLMQLLARWRWLDLLFYQKYGFLKTRGSFLRHLLIQVVPWELLLDSWFLPSSSTAETPNPQVSNLVLRIECPTSLASPLSSPRYPSLLY